ncbi:MAG: 50S ribosomal protein L29 [Candidatus Omnitrophica bacterium]|nr:50S ribosomal protein L29 [Candidatus Omnitrophota bacterium]
MKATEIRNMTVAEIEQKLISLKEQMFKIRAEVTTGRVERPHRFRLLKRDIARCYTILKEKSGEEGKTE